MHTPSLYSQENLISAAHNVHPWRWSRVYVRQSGLLLSTLMSTCWRSRSDQRRRVISRFMHFMLMCCIYSLALQASSWSSQEWLVSGHSKFNITRSSKHILGTHEAWNNTPKTDLLPCPDLITPSISQPPIFICIPLTTISALWTLHLL